MCLHAIFPSLFKISVSLFVEVLVVCFKLIASFASFEKDQARGHLFTPKKNDTICVMASYLLKDV